MKFIRGTCPFSQFKLNLCQRTPNPHLASVNPQHTNTSDPNREYWHTNSTIVTNQIRVHMSPRKL